MNARIDEILEEYLHMEKRYPDWHNYSYYTHDRTNMLYRYNRDLSYDKWDTMKREWVRCNHPGNGTYHYINSYEDLFVEML